VGATGLSGWSFGNTAGVTQKFLVGDGAGGSTTGGVYSFGSGTDTPGTPVDPSTDRALGLIGTSSLASTVGVTLVNTFGVALNQITISYDGQVWHMGTGSTANPLTFGYALGASSILDSAATFNPDTNLDYVVTPTGTAGALDGNAAGNNTQKTDTISQLNWAPGETLVLRWSIGGVAQAPGLAIDNFSFSAQATPAVTASDAGGAFTGNPLPATALVNGSASLEGVVPTLNYYVGTGTGGTNLGATAPSAIGTYTVVANFAGSTDYTAAASNPVTFSISQATPTVTVSDAGGTFNGTPFPGAALVNGGASLEGVVPTLNYYVGTGTGGANLGATAPTAAGTYTVVANFAGSTDYSAASSTPVTFNISQATPSVTVTDAGGTYTGNPFPATPLVNGTSSLEGVAPTLTYFMGTGTGGTNLGATAPSAVGTYTVVASFAGSANYAAASSGPVTFNISPAQVTSLSVEKGLSERSYIRYVDLTFNTPLTGLSVDAAHVTLTHYNLDGTLNAGNGVTNLGVESLSGVSFTQLTDHVMELDFGAGGIGGNENLANTIGNWAALTSADGIYKLTIDPDGTGQHDITETFYRMFGDVIGNTAGGPTQTGGTTGIGAVSNADVTAITAALGQTSSGVPLNADVNGAGSVSANDRALVAKSLGRHLTAGIQIDD
jgi:hypothetical protein